MKLLIDDARIEEIRRIYESYPVDGVTTNPTILSKSGRPPYAVLREIRAFIGPEAELHVQTLSRQASGILKEARRIVEELGEHTFVKVPAVPEGFRAMKALRQEGIPFTATAIYAPMQAVLAGKCGAAYAAPYVNRIDNLGYHGVETVREIHGIFRTSNLPTEVLAASFRNSQQVLELCRAGVGAVTVSPEIMEGLVKNQIVTDAVEAFIADFEDLNGLGSNMYNC